MGLFGKKEDEGKEKVESQKSEETILKEELDEEVKNLQQEFRKKVEEIKENEKKLNRVKDEYDLTVSNLMELKKETNLKKMELDIVKREHKEIQLKIEEAAKKNEKNIKLINELEKNESNLKNVKQELEKSILENNKINEKISIGQAKLQELKEEIKIQNELEKKENKLPNKEPELKTSEDKNTFSNKEEKFIKEQIEIKQDTKGIIEAASIVTSSLKSKLSKVEKELETVQKILEKERMEHSITMEKLKKLQNKRP